MTRRRRASGFGREIRFRFAGHRPYARHDGENVTCARQCAARHAITAQNVDRASLVRHLSGGRACRALMRSGMRANQACHGQQRKRQQNADELSHAPRIARARAFHNRISRCLGHAMARNHDRSAGARQMPER